MKHSILIIILIISALTIQAQSDIIYPEIGKVGVSKCTITSVTDGNQVHYTKDTISDVMEAVTIRWKRKFFSLYATPGEVLKNPAAIYDSKDNNFYLKQYKRAIRTRNVGIAFTVLGVASGIVGGLTLSANQYTNKPMDNYRLLYYGGAILTNLGVMLWVSEGIRAENNGKAMKKAKNNTNLSLGATNNGLGLLLTFN